MPSNLNDQYVQFVNVKKSYDQKNLVVKDFNLDIREGEFVTLLGPSGSGKSTCLMMLAGFEEVSSGSILIEGKPVTNIAPYYRNIGVVFQHYALFPHMTIAENLSYPLKVRKMSAEVIAEKVAATLELVELTDFGKRYPGQLSGGQQQRVAVARALIFEASIILMDEPLGALDKNLREQMQLEIKRLHKKIGFTAIYVTHDQTEALTMSDRIAVFDDGIVQQCAEPAVLYEEPSNLFVANFIGENNNITGVIRSIDEKTVTVTLANGDEAVVRNGNCTDVGAVCTMTIRPENLFINKPDPLRQNNVDSKFLMNVYVGDSIHYYFALSCGTQVWVKLLNDHDAPVINEGDSTHLSWPLDRATAFQESVS
ncbi:MAG: putative spermidine/putrescine transport system ATP-binding protein [Cellvibrionaceae bacterium]|jgi:putative spermidine/putrescine transport system ATP-binding protein